MLLRGNTVHEYWPPIRHCHRRLAAGGRRCEKKKPQLPKQAKAPVEALPLPAEIAEAAPSEPVASTKPRRRQRSPSRSLQSGAGHASHLPPRARRAISRKSTGDGFAVQQHNRCAATPPPSLAEPHPDTAIAANVSSAQLTQQKQTTTQLIESTEKTLSGLSTGYRTIRRR